MAKISDKITDIKAESGYVTNSLYLKSSNSSGAVYKYLIKDNGTASRREVFFELDPDEDDGTDHIDRTVTDDVPVEPAA